MNIIEDRQETKQFTGKRTYTVDEIQDILNISRTTAYSLVKRNLFHSISIGGHIRISKSSFDTWLDNPPDLSTV